MCGTQDSRKMWNTDEKVQRRAIPNRSPVYETCHTKNDFKPWIYHRWYIVEIGVIWSKYINLFTKFTSLDTACPCCQWHLRQYWEDIYTSWRKCFVTHSWDLISIHSESSICGTIFQVHDWWYHATPTVNVFKERLNKHWKDYYFTLDPEDFIRR